MYYSTGTRDAAEELYYWSYPALYSRYAEDGMTVHKDLLLLLRELMNLPSIIMELIIEQVQ